MRRTIAATLATLLLAATGCGESKEEAAAREAAEKLEELAKRMPPGLAEKMRAAGANMSELANDPSRAAAMAEELKRSLGGAAEGMAKALGTNRTVTEAEVVAFLDAWEAAKANPRDAKAQMERAKLGLSHAHVVAKLSSYASIRENPESAAYLPEAMRPSAEESAILARYVDRWVALQGSE